MSPNSATIIGSPVSPYVRKVLAVCELKEVAYRLDPIVPFFGDDRFSELSPLRRVPVFVDDKVSLCDSTVICEYLEERYPTPRVLPVELAQRARDGFILGGLSMADLVVAIPFSNLKWARVEPEPSRWPKACAWVERTQATAALAKATRIADKLMQMSPNLHRAALADLGIELTDATIAADRARPSMMLDAT